MSEYIEKSVLLEAIEILRPDETMNLGVGAYITPYEAALEVFDYIKHEIRGAKPADVAPVVHGWWDCGDDMFEYAICSACKWDSGEAWEYAKKNFKFCPHCGAKMGESEG